MLKLIEKWAELDPYLDYWDGEVWWMELGFGNPDMMSLDHPVESVQLSVQKRLEHYGWDWKLRKIGNIYEAVCWKFRRTSSEPAFALLAAFVESLEDYQNGLCKTCKGVGHVNYEACPDCGGK